MGQVDGGKAAREGTMSEATVADTTAAADEVPCEASSGADQAADERVADEQVADEAGEADAGADDDEPAEPGGEASSDQARHESAERAEPLAGPDSDEAADDAAGSAPKAEDAGPEAGDDTPTVVFDRPVLAHAPGIGTRIGALNVSTLNPLGWVLMAAGILGTLLLAVSYLAGWLTASLEHFGVAETESLSLEQATSTPLSWMYRIATLGLIGCAFALVFVPRSARPLLRLGGFAAAGLALLTALVATVAIASLVTEGAEIFGDAETVEYGWGLYAGFLGVALLAGFVGGFEYLAGDEPRASRPRAAR